MATSSPSRWLRRGLLVLAWLLLVNVSLNVICTAAFWFAGMTPFDALNHALATIATGGLGTHDASLGYFKSLPILWVATFFMTLRSLPFSVLILFIVRGRLDTLKDPQIIVFLSYLTVLALAASL